MPKLFKLERKSQASPRTWQLEFWSRSDSRCSQFIFFLQSFTTLVSSRYFCDPLVRGQMETSDQSQSRDGALLTNERRVFSDHWETAPRRPELEHHLSESISGTTRFIPRERGDNNKDKIHGKVYLYCLAFYDLWIYDLNTLLFLLLHLRIMFHFHSFMCQHLSAMRSIFSVAGVRSLV